MYATISLFCLGWLIGSVVIMGKFGAADIIMMVVGLGCAIMHRLEERW